MVIFGIPSVVGWAGFAIRISADLDELISGSGADGSTIGQLKKPKKDFT